jgi:signal transduction histidine kinase
MHVALQLRPGPGWGTPMGSPLERRRTGGRRVSDNRDVRALRGLLHDLGHEVTTLSYLVDAIRGDTALPSDSGYRLELLSLEMSRMRDIIRHGLAGDGAGDAAPVNVQDLAAQLTKLAQAAYPAEVVLLPGAAAVVTISPVLLWRVLSNLVENAARAAGRTGTVTVAVRQAGTTVIDVTDDGPGFGAGPPGTASLGLEVVTALLESCGGALAVQAPPQGGTSVLVALPAEVTTGATPAQAGR